MSRVGCRLFPASAVRELFESPALSVQVFYLLPRIAAADGMDAVPGAEHFAADLLARQDARRPLLAAAFLMQFRVVASGAGAAGPPLVARGLVAPAMIVQVQWAGVALADRLHRAGPPFMKLGRMTGFEPATLRSTI